MVQYVADAISREWSIDYRPYKILAGTSSVEELAFNNTSYIRVYATDEQLAPYDHGRTIYAHNVAGTVAYFIPAYEAHGKYLEMEEEIGRILDSINVPETINLIRKDAFRQDDEKVLRGIIHFEVWAVG